MKTQHLGEDVVLLSRQIFFHIGDGPSSTPIIYSSGLYLAVLLLAMLIFPDFFGLRPRQMHHSYGWEKLFSNNKMMEVQVDYFVE